MNEFFHEAISIANLPITILMGVVLLYWLMVILGVLGMDAIDLDFGADADLDIDPGLDADAGGVFGEALAFLHIGEIPVMIIGSIVVFFMWTLSLISNYYLNSGDSILLAVAFLIPNVLISVLVTKGMVWPFLHVFKNDQTLVDTRENMIGGKGVVKTSEVTENFGQVEIKIDGPPIVINARTRSGERLVKGDCAKIIAYNSANDTFTVSLSKWEKE